MYILYTVVDSIFCVFIRIARAVLLLLLSILIVLLWLVRNAVIRWLRWLVYVDVFEVTMVFICVLLIVDDFIVIVAAIVRIVVILVTIILLVICCIVTLSVLTWTLLLFSTNTHTSTHTHHFLLLPNFLNLQNKLPISLHNIPINLPFLLYNLLQLTNIFLHFSHSQMIIFMNIHHNILMIVQILSIFIYIFLHYW